MARRTPKSKPGKWPSWKPRTVAVAHAITSAGKGLLDIANSQSVQPSRTQSVTESLRISTQAVPVRMPIRRTEEPVSEDEEKREDAERARLGVEPVQKLEDAEADATWEKIVLELPDKLYLIPPTGSHLGEMPATPEWEYVWFNPQPIKLDTPDDCIVRRMRMEIGLSSGQKPVPVVFEMEPKSLIEKTTSNIAAKLGLSLGVPPVAITFGTDLPVHNTTNLHHKIVASGRQSHVCQWVVSDEYAGPLFDPELTVQASNGQPFKATVILHVEVWKKIHGIFGKTYGKSSEPYKYEYQPGKQVMTLFAFDEELVKTYHPGDEDSEERRAAYERGGSYAMFYIGLSQSDFTKAKLWIGRAADAGETHAWKKFGDRLRWAQRPEEAIQCYQQAFNAGDFLVGIELGDLLRNQNRPEAERCYRTAAQRLDNPEAMNKLGELLEATDPYEAERWYQRGAAHDSTEARQNLKRLHPWKSRLHRRLWLVLGSSPAHWQLGNWLVTPP